ncbi:MAG: cupin domain-containing protein, partial [Pseudolabrys sp.]
MHVKRFADAKPYDAPNHRNYTSLRMFGAEAGGTKGLVFGYSHFLPGGGAGPDASPPEKVYFVLRGELTVIVKGKET